MIEYGWAGEVADFRYDLWERRLQLYDQTAIVSYTIMLTYLREGEIHHQTHNESRVLVFNEGHWQVVHVHKSPSWQAPYQQD